MKPFRSIVSHRETYLHTSASLTSLFDWIVLTQPCLVTSSHQDLHSVRLFKRFSALRAVSQIGKKKKVHRQNSPELVSLSLSACFKNWKLYGNMSHYRVVSPSAVEVKQGYLTIALQKKPRSVNHRFEYGLFCEAKKDIEA